MFIVGIGIIIGGYFFSEIFLRIVYTEIWATKSAVSIMRLYSVYMLFTALNGITEAYIYSKADKDTLRLL
jgi:O-antigen/teichoic acid export membrane protein